MVLARAGLNFLVARKGYDEGWDAILYHFRSLLGPGRKGVSLLGRGGPSSQENLVGKTSYICLFSWTFHVNCFFFFLFVLLLLLLISLSHCSFQ